MPKRWRQLFPEISGMRMTGYVLSALLALAGLYYIVIGGAESKRTFWDHEVLAVRTPDNSTPRLTPRPTITPLTMPTFGAPLDPTPANPLTPTETPQPERTREASPTPSPTETPLETPVETPPPTPEPTAVAVTSPTPTQTPEPSAPILLAADPARKVMADAAAAPVETPTDSSPRHFEVNVKNKAGQPVTGADVTVVYRDGGEAKRARGRTGADGRFETSVAGGTPVESVGVEAPGYASESRKAIPAEDMQVSIEMERLTGLRGIVVGATGVPITNAFSAMIVARGGVGGGGDTIDLSSTKPRVAMRERFTNTDGKFQFGSIEPGEYTAAIWTDAGMGGLSEPVEIKSGQTPGEIRVVVRKDLQIAGVVSIRTDGPERPIAGAKVTARNQNAALAMAQIAPITATTDAEGKYALSGLAGGLYDLSVQNGMEGAPGAEKRNQALPGNVKTARVDFTLEPQQIVLSGVVRGEDNQPLAGAQLLLIRQEPLPGQQQVRADSRGAFEIPNLIKGVYKLGFTHPAEPNRQKMLLLSLVDSGEVEPRFYTRTAVRGRLTRQGAPVQQGVVRIMQRRDPGYTLAGGTFEFPINSPAGQFAVNLEPGVYDFSATGAGSVRVEVPAAPAEAPEVQILVR